MRLWREGYLLMGDRAIHLILIRINLHWHLLHWPSIIKRILIGMHIRRRILKIHLMRHWRHCHRHWHRHRSAHRHLHLIHVSRGRVIWWQRMLIRIWLTYICTLERFFCIYFLFIGRRCFFLISLLSVNTIFLSLFGTSIGVIFLLVILLVNFLFFSVVVIVVGLAMTLICDSLKNNLAG